MKLSKFKRELRNEYNESFPKDETVHVQKTHTFPKRLIPLFAVCAILLVFIGVFAVDGIAVGVHNQRVDSYYTAKESSFSPLSIYEKTTASKKKLYQKKTSLWSEVCSGFTNMFGSIKLSPSYGTAMSPEPATTGSPMNDSYGTNVQVSGVDEADYAKCDGKYIYYSGRDGIRIYNLAGELVASDSNGYGELFIYNQTIVVLGGYAQIYSFTEEKLEKKLDIHGCILTNARVFNGHLYLVRTNWEDIEPEENVYYDGYSCEGSLTELISIDLTTYEEKKVSDVGNCTTLYMNESYIALGKPYAEFSLISIYKATLEPVTAVLIRGKILNQYSLDIQEDQLRLVTSELSCGDYINRLYLFDLAGKERLSILEEGIGQPGQMIKSATFSGNTCYVCTYRNTDPLYEIDLSDPRNPRIVSEYKAPGYSGYLYTWSYDGCEYVLGLGYDDYRQNKISVYQKTKDGTIQIGKDFVITEIEMIGSSHVVKNLNWSMFSTPKQLFIYTVEDKLYLGENTGYETYEIFEINLGNPECITTVYKTFDAAEGRCFLIGGRIYLPNADGLIIESFK